MQREQEEIPRLVDFPCKAAVTRGRETAVSPLSVHELRPGDVKVVAALGDSITAANGAMAYSEEQTRLNYRGVSAMAGQYSTYNAFCLSI